MYCCQHFVFTCLIVAIGVTLHAEEDPIFSGPQVGEKLVAFDVLAAYGDDAGREVDLVSAAEGNPLLIVFIHKLTRPSADLSRVLMHYGDMRKDDGLRCALVLLDDDRSKMEEYLRRAVAWWHVGPAVGISLDGAEGPGAYGLNRNVTLTVLVARENKVTANFAIVQPSLTDAPKILGEVSKLVGGRPLTTAEIELLRAPSRLLPIAAARQQGRGPQDARLRQLLCDLLQSSGDKEQTLKTVAAIEKYVDADRSLQVDLYQAAKLVTGQRYGGQKPILHRVPQLRQVLAGWIKQYAVLLSEETEELSTSS